MKEFVARVRPRWGPITSELVAACRRAMIALASTPGDTPWVTELLAERPEQRDLVQVTPDSFGLHAYVEKGGVYRPPHDHGNGWVIYAVMDGAVEMRTYAKVSGPSGALLVERDRGVIGPGDVRVYLPGDIHDTRCLAPSTMKIRMVSCDFSVERSSGRMTEYVQRGGVWTSP